MAMDSPLDKYPDLAERKQAFAKLALKRPREVARAAFRVFEDTSDALFASQHWPADPEILRIMDEVRDEFGPDAFLPTKDEFKAEILEHARDPKQDPKVRQGFYTLYASVDGLIAKEALKVDVGGSAVKELMAKIGEAGRPKPKGAA
jgi:hypothetical protein